MIFEWLTPHIRGRRGDRPRSPRAGHFSAFAPAVAATPSC